MRILCVFGRYNYGDPARGEGYEYTNFIPALKNLGHEVELFDSFSRPEYNDFAGLNRALVLKVNSFRPEIVFCVLMGYEVWLETFELIRRSGARLVHWGTDDSWKYPQFSRLIASCFDVWVTTARSAMEAAGEDGLTNFHLSQWAAGQSDLHPPLPAAACRYAASFIGSAYGNRPKWIQGLKERGIDVACFGHGWPQGPVSSSDVRRIIRESLVSLNFGDSGVQFRGLLPYRSRQIKARIFEVPGAGGCLLTEPAENLDSYYEAGRELDVFSSPDELANRIRLLTSEPHLRDRIAQAGYERTAAEHTYEIRFSEVFKLLPPTTGFEPINLPAFESTARYHRLSPTARLARWIYTAPFRLVWGERRGMRAARRLLFELLWRVTGRTVYTSGSLPGRWFYHES